MFSTNTTQLTHSPPPPRKEFSMAGPNKADIQEYHIPILKNYLEEYKLADKTQRQDIITKAHKDIKQVSPDMTPLVTVALRKVNPLLVIECKCT